MFSKTLVVCLLAFLCLNVCFAEERLNTRIAGGNIAVAGQFPYIAFVTYNYLNAQGQLVSQQGTGIIYSDRSVITTANTFNNFPPSGGEITIEVGAYDINSPVAFFKFNATIGTYAIPTTGTPPAAPSDLIVIPTQFAKGQSAYDVAIIRLPAGANFDFNNREVAIANFPTSSPIPSNQLYAVAYGNQAPNSATFPQLKFTQMFLKRKNLCQKEQTAEGLNLYDVNQHYCIQSKALNDSGNSFNGVCRLDIGGAVVRTGNPQNPDTYYEVVGLISYANDTTTCDATKRVPAIVLYLSFFQDGFFTPILGTLAAAGNGQDATKNPDAAKGNFICGNGVIEGFEKCDPVDPTTEPCCNVNICAYYNSGKRCDKSDTSEKNVCLTRKICDQFGGCAAHNRTQRKTRCAGKGSKCVGGVCIPASSSA